MFHKPFSTSDSQTPLESTLKEQPSVDSNSWKFEGSSSTRMDGFSSSHDSKPEQPFARSQLGTVKKNLQGPPKNGNCKIMTTLFLSQKFDNLLMNCVNFEPPVSNRWLCTLHLDSTKISYFYTKTYVPFQF